MRNLEVPDLSDERVVLRCWRLADAAALMPACGDAAIRRFTTVPDTFTPEGARAWISRQHARANDGSALVWAVVSRGHDLPIGMIGLFGLGERDTTARFGYWLISDQRGHGLATAAAVLVAQWAFSALELTAIHIDREPANAASARIAERLGAALNGSHHVNHEGEQLELVRHTLFAPSRDQLRAAAPAGGPLPVHHQG